ncbi:mCG1044913 [Mus musculus]|nr:mCG1044913 [Mus musculus]
MGNLTLGEGKGSSQRELVVSRERSQQFQQDEPEALTARAGSPSPDGPVPPRNSTPDPGRPHPGRDTHLQLAGGVRSQPTGSRPPQPALGPHFRTPRAPSASIRRLAEHRVLDGPPLPRGEGIEGGPDYGEGKLEDIDGMEGYEPVTESPGGEESVRTE